MSNIITRNLNGDEFIVSAQSTLDEELNGNQTLHLKISPNNVNDLFIKDIDSMWEVDFLNTTYIVVYTKKNTVGHSFYVDVKAVHKGLDRLSSIRTYERYDGSLTAMNAFTRTFRDTGYSFVIQDSFNSISIEGFGDGETRLESFKRLLERFKAEFYISGSTFYISKYIGRDTGFEYRYRLNASDVQNEVDGTSTFTYARGFGDYEESEQNVLEKAKIKREYESPLAKILGRRHAPMVAKGSYKTNKAIDDALREVVDNSIVISISADVKDLRKQGYPYAQPILGDRVFLNDKRIDFNDEVRVVQLTTERYANGSVRNINVVFGNQKLGRRYASNLSSQLRQLNDLLNGRIELEFDVLDVRAKEMLRKIMSVDTELKLDNGIYAIDKNDPNNVVGLNSAGWFISTDGGQTSKVIATAEGIHADAITVGTLVAQRMHSIDKNTTVSIEGGKMNIDRKDGHHLELGIDGLAMYNPSGSKRFSIDRTYVSSAAIGTSNSNVYLATGVGNEVRTVDIRNVPSDGIADSYRYVPIRTLGIRARPDSNLYIGTEHEIRFTSSGFRAEDGTEIYRNIRGHNAYMNALDVNDGENLYLRPKVNGEVMITRTNTTDVYKDIRGGFANFNGIRTNASGVNMYIGTDEEVRFTGKSFASDSSIVYRDVRGAGARFNFIETNSSTNMYVRSSSGGEVRFTSKGSTDNFVDFRGGVGWVDSITTRGTNANFYVGTDNEIRFTGRSLYNSGSPIYRDARANGYYGNFLESNSGTNVYIRPSSGGELRVTRSGTTSSYLNLRADKLYGTVVESSSEEFKTNIEKWETDASQMIRDMVLYEYNYKNKLDKGIEDRNHGVIVERETPEHIIDGKGISTYELLSTVTKAVQEILTDNDKLKERIEVLENGTESIK